MSSEVKMQGSITVDNDKEELTNLRVEKQISTALEGITKTMTSINERTIRIEDKVVIHNNYERRITDLEKNQWKIFGLFAGTVAVLSIILKYI